MPTRLQEQATWNAIATQLRWGDDDVNALRSWGVEEYFEGWGAPFPWGDDFRLTLWPNSALTAEERAAIQPLVDVLNEAWDQSDGMTADEFLSSPWPDRIAASARQARQVMRSRGGLFSKTVEEDVPSLPFPN